MLWNILFFIPFIILALLSSSLSVVTQIRGHIAGPLPSPLWFVVPLISGVEFIIAFLVDSRRTVPAHAARRSQQLVDPFCFCFCFLLLFLAFFTSYSGGWKKKKLDELAHHTSTYFHTHRMFFCIFCKYSQSLTTGGNRTQEPTLVSWHSRVTTRPPGRPALRLFLVLVCRVCCLWRQEVKKIRFHRVCHHLQLFPPNHAMTQMTAGLVGFSWIGKCCTPVHAHGGVVTNYYVWTRRYPRSLITSRETADVPRHAATQLENKPATKKYRRSRLRTAVWVSPHCIRTHEMKTVFCFFVRATKTADTLELCHVATENSNFLTSTSYYCDSSQCQHTREQVSASMRALGIYLRI